MDVVKAENIKVPNAVLVSGLTGKSIDDEVFQYLQQYGKIERTIEYHGNIRIRPFSGRIPCPNAESDYETWRSNVEFQLGDPTVSDMHTTRKIIESLLPPAANIVKHLGPSSTPHEYLAMLDSAYGIVEDGDELFAKFLTTNQDSGENPSAYVQRLQAILSKVVRRGGLVASETDSQLLKQFCRGCWDNALITSLQLEQKKIKPPSFSELLLLLRTEEDRQAAKSSRMRQHLGLKVKAQLHSITSNEHVPDISAVASASEAYPGQTQKLEKQMEALQAQIASLKASLTSKQGQSKKKPKSQTKLSTEDDPPSSAEFNHKRKPRPWYCFRCGENGHIKPSCTSEPNPELVEQKNKELKQKQAAWENLN
uniref:paraneoplastic antigen Ma3 homolog n=1 Tax=Scatophagus argus TaxID=75038 RepID=UPI001ED84FCD|nr:paraneoplastic antigen Ma3 homolog [Scatophagus argus]